MSLWCVAFKVFWDAGFELGERSFDVFGSGDTGFEIERFHEGFVDVLRELLVVVFARLSQLNHHAPFQFFSDLRA